jgi:hypothetical protein
MGWDSRDRTGGKLWHERTGLPRQEIEDRMARKLQYGQDREYIQDRTPGQDNKGRTAGEDSRGRTTRT